MHTESVIDQKGCAFVYWNDCFIALSCAWIAFDDGRYSYRNLEQDALNACALVSHAYGFISIHEPDGWLCT